MSEQKTIVKKMSDNIWQMNDDNSMGYVITGTDKALVIDTMNGTDNVYDIVRSITDLPIILVNSHSHPDHIGGNCFFEDVYLHAEDAKWLDFFTPPERKFHSPKVHELKEGDVIDIGGCTFEVFELPGHTLGSILLLYREARILFSGDTMNRHLWMQLEGCLTLKEYLANLKRLDFLKERADRILHGHSPEFEDMSLMSDVERGIQEVAEQKGTEVSDNDKPYEWFGGVDKIHVYDEKGSAICYTMNNIR